MRDRCDRINVRDVGIRIAERFQIDRLGVLFDCAFDFRKVMRIDEGGLDAELRECVREQIVAAAVDRSLCDDVVAGLCQCLDRVGDRCRAGGKCQCGDAALQCRDALLKDTLRGVCQSAVDIAGVSQSEAGCRVCGILENIRCGRVDRDGSCVRSGIGLFLSDVQLECFKLIFAHGDLPQLSYIINYHIIILISGLRHTCRSGDCMACTMLQHRLPLHIRPLRRFSRVRAFSRFVMRKPPFLTAAYNRLSVFPITFVCLLG